MEKRVAGRYGLGSLGAALVGNPAVGAMVEHNRLLYADLCDPVRVCFGARQQHHRSSSSYWTYAAHARDALNVKSEVQRMRLHGELMANSQPLVADEILDAYPLAKHNGLLDVGGGDGSFLIEAGKRHSHLGLTLFDLPPVAERATQRFATLGLLGLGAGGGREFSRRSVATGVRHRVAGARGFTITTTMPP